MLSLPHASLLVVYPFTLESFLRAAAIYTPATLLNLYLLFHPRNQWLVDNRSRVGTKRKAVALTFDDGPDPVSTPRLLDILRKEGVPATFFAVGERVERHPDIVRRAIVEGHLVENHTWGHPSMFCFLMPWRLRDEIDRCGSVISRACGRPPRYFRSPVGLRHPFLRPYLERRQLEYISWRVRTRDTLEKKPAVLVERVLRKATSGDIILFHDHQRDGVEPMLEALPQVIHGLRARGFEFVLVGAPAEAESRCPVAAS